MKRWKITVEYDGADFCGWQRQVDVLSVQGALEEAINKFSGENVTLHVAGRTDAGVHAYANVAHFDLAKITDPATISDAVNFHVRPHKVAVLKTESVSDEFHARFNALARSYQYRIICRRAPPVLHGNHAWHVTKPLDIARMNEAAQLLIGHHDFSTFRAQGCQSNSPLKTLDQLHVTAAHEGESEMIIFSTKARSFLYHQVRNMVGTLSLVGNGQWSIADFKSAFDAHDRTKGGPTAPPQGLFFKEVEYPHDP